jgi:hypothetical protein
MFLKEKIMEKEKFNAFKLIINGYEQKTLTVKIKNLTYEQLKKAKTILKENINDLETVKEIFLTCTEGLEEDIDYVMNNDEAITNILKLVFVDTDFNTNFVELALETIEYVISDIDLIFNKFMMVLIKFGYKVLELEHLNQKEIAALAIKEMFYRDPNVFITFFEEECFDYNTKQISEEKRKLYDYLIEVKDKLGIKTVSDKPVNNGMSDFEQLQNL